MIRIRFGYTLEQMSKCLEEKLNELGYENIPLYSGNIHEYEKGRREPMLPVLLAYARLGNTSLDKLVDDDLRKL